MRMEDFEGVLTWLYSLCYPNEKTFDESKVIDGSDFMELCRTVHIKLHTIQAQPTGYCKNWVKDVIYKVLDAQELVQKLGLTDSRQLSNVTWGQLVACGVQQDLEYAKIVRQNSLGGFVFKKRVPLPTSETWPDVASVGDKWTHLE